MTSFRCFLSIIVDKQLENDYISYKLSKEAYIELINKLQDQGLDVHITEALPDYNLFLKEYNETDEINEIQAQQMNNFVALYSQNDFCLKREELLKYHLPIEVVVEYCKCPIRNGGIYLRVKDGYRPYLRISDCIEDKVEILNTDTLYPINLLQDIFNNKLYFEIPEYYPISEITKTLEEVLDTFSLGEKSLIQLIYKDQIPTKAIASEFNIPTLAVEILQAKTLRKLRHPSRSKLLRDYLSIPYI